MAERRSKNNDKYFEKIPKLKTIDVDYKKYKNQIGNILQQKLVYETAKRLKKKHYKEYNLYKEQERKAFENLLNAIPDSTD